MNSFYTLLILTILLGSLAGYMAGFIRIVFLLIKITTAITAAYFLNSNIAEVISNNIPASAEWAQAIAFTGIFLLSFLLLQLLFIPIVRHTVKFNKTVLNKAGGAMTGFAGSLIAVLLFIQSTDIIAIPQGMEDEIKSQGIADAINQPVEMVNDKFIPIFQKQPVQVMASEAADSTSEAGITLAFVTNNFEIRPDLEAVMLRLVNEERSKYGLRLLVADKELTAAARAHSADMFSRGYFSHNTPNGLTPFQRLHNAKIVYLYAGENLAMAPTLLKAHEGLMKSPGHRENILRRSYGRIGIGILDGGTHGLMITQEFRN